MERGGGGSRTIKCMEKKMEKMEEMEEKMAKKSMIKRKLLIERGAK
jgi:hypothetical protein